MPSPKVANAVAALFDPFIGGCGGGSGFVKGCPCGSGVVWIVRQRLWLRFSALLKVTDVVAVLFDSLLGGFGGHCSFAKVFLVVAAFLE